MKFEFKLYVYGRTGTSIMAERNLREVIEDAGESECSLEVVDILENPEKSLEDNVIATPTVVRTIPPPKVKLIGDMSDAKSLKDLLGFR